MCVTPLLTYAQYICIPESDISDFLRQEYLAGLTPVEYHTYMYLVSTGVGNYME
jgi:hypothetical protein